MQDVTDHVARFREAARHLWNTAFHPVASWDDRDRFDVVIAALFDALVLAPAAIVGASLPPMAERDPPSIPALRVGALGAELPIMINREIPSGAYWDDPVRRVGDPGLVLDFVRFFDWDELGPREFRFLEVLVRKLPGHRALEGRRALVEFGHVRVLACPHGAP